MRIPELWEYYPNYEPLPPLTELPPRIANKFGIPGIGEIGDGSIRWCACRAFQVYRGSGRFGTLVKPGETVSMMDLWYCDAVTRNCFHKNHHKVMLNFLAKAAGFGYKCCLISDTTPREPFEVAELFGLRVRQVDITMARNTRAAVERRGQKFNKDRDRFTQSKSLANEVAGRIKG